VLVCTAVEGTPRLDSRIAFVVIAAALLAAPLARSSPNQYLTVGDRLEAELRILDLYPRRDLADRLKLPHTGSRPLTLAEIEGTAPPLGGARPAVALSAARLERVLGRDPTPGFVPSLADPATPRLFQRSESGDQTVEFSMGVEGALLTDKADAGSAVVSGSGVHARIGVGFDRWLIFTHLVTGRFAHGQRIADPIVFNTDIIILTEDTYLSYIAGSGRWGTSFGRGRWHWGPGEEGSLLLSRTAAPITALSMHGSLESFHLTGTILNSTLQSSAGEQFAAHRLEWQPFDALRVGAAEAVRYQGSGWEWAYAIGVFPFAVAQRLLAQDEPDSTEALHNNILTSFDAAWRIVPGHRVYGELLVDDLHSRTRANPDKIAWQLGYDGAGMLSRQRLTWGAEVTRVWRYVYTSYFGRVYSAQDQPLGFPTGPDALRARARLSWDPSRDWQATVRFTHTKKGENSLDEPYFPGDPRPDASTFEGIVERNRDLELAARFWPAGGIDIALRSAWRHSENYGHVTGVKSDDWLGAIELHLVR
jgi:YD repeat-containing protein